MGIFKLTNIGAAVAGLLLAATAGAQLSEPAARKAMDKLNKEYDRAMMAKNIGWFQSVYAPDYFMFDGQNNIARTDALNNLQHQSFEKMLIKGVSTKVDKVHPMKKGVYVISTTTYSIQEAGKKPSSFPLQYEEFWTNTGGKWMVHYLKIKVQNAAPAKPAPSMAPALKVRKGH